MSVIKNLIIKVRYELFIFGLLMLELIRYVPAPNNLQDWCTTPYAMTYRFGFNSRLLIGSFLNSFTPYLTEELLFVFISMSIIILCILIAVALGIVIRSSEDGYKYSILVLIAIYLASPASVSFLFQYINFGRLDIYLLIFTITALFFAGKSKLKFMVPVLCFLSMATHQVFAFTYLVIILGILLYEVYEQKCSKISLFYAIITGIVAGVSFVYLQFLAPSLNYQSSCELIEAIRTRTNIPISQTMIEYEYFKTIADHWSKFVVPSWEHRVLTGIITLCLLLPQSLLIFSIWKETIKNVSAKMLKILLFLMMIAPVAAVPAFVLTIDWGRWFASIFITQFCFLFYLAFKKCTPVISALEKMQINILHQPLAVILFILYLTALGKFEASAILGVANRMAIIISTVMF